jgi:hypothetical protein
MHIDFGGHVPHGCQTENWVINPTHYWERAGVLQWNQVQALAEAPDQLWLNGCETNAGINDQVPLNVADQFLNSLHLIHVDLLQVRVFAPGAHFGDMKRRVQGYFEFGNHQYALWITDPIIEAFYKRLPDGQFTTGEAFLTISLGEPFRDHRQKLIAAVIRPAGVIG